MPKPRAKRKWFSDWQYVPKLRRYEQIPLQTTQDGVRTILLLDGIKVEDVSARLLEIDSGEIYKPRRGLFSTVHRRMLTIEERLRFTAFAIKKIGISSCWWLKETGMVWWQVAEEDAPFLDGRHPDVTAASEIRTLFLAHREVTDVRIEVEALPNFKREPRWVEVYPGRF